MRISDTKTLNARSSQNEQKWRAPDFVGSVLRVLAALSALAVVALFAAFLLMLRIGHWLVKQDNLQKADAIAVLSGGFPARALEAAELYRAGYAREIWLTKPGAESSVLKEMGIHYPSEADFNYRVLVRQGIPAKAIHILERPVGSTADEVDVINDVLTEKTENSVIIVTEKAHTRRVHMLWTRLKDSHAQAIIRGVTDDEFDPDGWWNHSEDTQQVMHEMVSLANLWASMPVHTRMHEQMSAAKSAEKVTVRTAGTQVRTADPTEEE